MKNQYVIGCAIVASFIIPTAGHAVEVMRCNAQVSPGLYQPILRIVQKTAITDIAIGERGLTRKQFYKDALTRNYVNSEFGIALSSVTGKISSLCGAQEEVDRDSSEPSTPEPTTTASEPDREPETETDEVSELAL